jgi:branched-chain amino acid transport system ATP-binding protein
MTENTQKVLEIDTINSFYGLSHILFDVTIDIQKGQITCLLGRNGSGKTTTIRSVVGLTPPKSGNIRFLGEEIQKLPAHSISKKGIKAAFSEQRVFGDLTVRENLEINSQSNSENQDDWGYDRIYNLFPILKKYESRWARTLSGGEQQMLCIANALMGNPILLLLDEPTIGLAPVIIDLIEHHIRQLKDKNISILLTEQNVKFAQELGDECFIIDTGEIRYKGTFRELLNNDYVVRTYLAV